MKNAKKHFLLCQSFSSTDFHMTPPGTGGISEGSFSMKNQGSEGIGGILGFSADGDAPLRYGGDF